MRAFNAFAEAVHRWRKSRGMSMEEVARHAGYSPSYLSKMLHGRRRLVPAVVSQIETVLETGGELARIAQEQEGLWPPLMPRQLPPAPPDFVGRETYLHQLNAALLAPTRPGASVVAVIEGGVWVGKTALALHWAAQVEGHFPGGALYADLRGIAPGAPVDGGEVLDAFLLALSEKSDSLRGTLDERAARYRSLLGTRPALVVLDNIADYNQVRHLLPGAGSVALLTSREHQTEVLLHSGGIRLDLPPLSSDEAMTLLRRLIGDAQVEADLESATTLVRRCGGLPMAVFMAAERVQRGRLVKVAAELSGEERLDLLSSHSDASVNLLGALDLSYLALTPRARRVFRLLGVVPATLSVEATGALAALPHETVREVVDELRNAYMLEESRAGRLLMNQLLRDYAQRRARDEDRAVEVERACDRVLRWYLNSAWHAGNALAPNWAGTALAAHLDDTGIAPLTFDDSGYDGALAWCEAELTTALCIADQLRGSVPDAVWQLPTLFLPYFYVAKLWNIWLTAATRSLDAARRNGLVHGVPWCLHSLGRARYEIGWASAAASNLAEALHLHVQLADDARVRSWVAFTLGSAYRRLGRTEEARGCFLKADDTFAQQDFDFGRAFTCAALASIYQESGDISLAIDTARQAVDFAAEVPSIPVLSLARHHYGMLLLEGQRYQDAVEQFDAALNLRRKSGERWGEAETSIARAEALTALGFTSQARACYREADGILTSLGDPRALDVEARIAALELDGDACGEAGA
ncbi:helix-turn-helix domain-containing protein [Prauserella sp. PE36]|uniref:helix-turn-helix domain-containing protein n=1 Tax=Prauserella sp. PE36 TaxID=1504709 RepID=UPI002101F775|nr:helix-turn-helix domain-containing protein [Prauserella sp. PE36]